MQRKVSKQDIRDMRRQHKDGATIKALAKQYHISFTTAYGNLVAESASVYCKELAKKRQKLPEYRAFSRFLKTSLNEIEESDSWVAEQVGVTRQMFSLYKKGKSIPTEDVLKDIFYVLDVKYKTIDDVVKAYKR